MSETDSLWIKRKRLIRQDCKAFGDPSIARGLIMEEEERRRRDKKRVKLCPICGRKPEIPFINAGRHIYSGNCEKCQARFTIHVIE
jgi:hypothetical protein